ncbi:MAG TPA: hypothetical protein VFW11_00955 [Cyclobacteriaceae bacterium]|nr:hypothetical protein [Cyclobacteriaceae bacterium]
MKKKLEDFINASRGAFDDKDAPEKVWKNIDASLKLKQPSLWNSIIIWRAAAVIFMCLSGYLLLPKGNGQLRDQKETLQEFNAVEEFYVQQISDKVKLIDEYERMEGLNGFTNDFRQLEAMYLVLKEEMKIRPSKKVKDALVLNLLVRIDLLNQQLHKLESGEYSDSKDKDNHQASS